MQLFYGTFFILSVVFQLKLLAISKSQLPKANPIKHKQHRVSIAYRQYQRVFKRVIELKFFGRAISNDDNVENEIEVQQEAVQLTGGAGQKLEGNPNSNAANACTKVK